MWLDIVSYLTNYILLELWGVMLLYYALSHCLWAFYFRYQGACDWYLAFLPFKLQFMKMELSYESNILPIVYIITCLVCSCLFPLWVVPAVLSTVMSHKYYSCFCDKFNPLWLSLIPLAGKLYMLMEVVSNERDGAE